MAGATILVDGRVCPILNVAGLLTAGALNRGETATMHTGPDLANSRPTISGEGRL
jgi:chemotaxis protein histidine kinase CheA